MNQDKILILIQEIFREVLDDDTILIKPETTSNDLEDWDSLNHIQLIVAIEKKFKIKFLNSEIQKWDNISQMIDNIITKI